MPKLILSYSQVFAFCKIKFICDHLENRCKEVIVVVVMEGDGCGGGGGGGGGVMGEVEGRVRFRMTQPFPISTAMVVAVLN